MNKALLLTAITIGLFTTACTGSGFIATLKDGVDIKGDGGPTEVSNGNPTSTLKGGIAGAGTITVGGALISENGGQLNSQLKITQSTLRPQSADLTHLDQIESNTNFVQIGCNPSIPSVANFINGLTEIKISADDTKETLAIKAKIVVICGKNALPQPFLTIVADQLVMLDANLEISTSTGAGFFAAYINKLVLTGSNQISSKVSDSSGLELDAPSLTLIAQQSLQGKGTLELKTIGAKQSAIVRK